MKKLVSECESISFEVLEYTDQDACRAAENKYLANAVYDKYLLNRSFDAHSNKGCKWTEEEKALMSAANKGVPRSGRPKINRIA